jgi:hypothetical protein
MTNVGRHCFVAIAACHYCTIRYALASQFGIKATALLKDTYATKLTVSYKICAWFKGIVLI